MKILLAVDGSKHSQWAEGLLRQMGGGHAVEVLYVTPAGGAVVAGAAGAPTLTEVLRECGEKMVRTVAKSLGSKFKTSTTVLESHDVAGAVLDRAKKIRADLIVLGARGLSPLKTFFLGSVSHKITRHAPCSVLVAHRRPGRALHILSAVDGSPASRRATGFLDTLGVPRSAGLTFLHVVAEPLVLWIPETGFPGGYGNMAAFEESLKALRQRGERVLADAKKEWAGRYKTVRTLLREGYPSGEILRAAKSTKANLLVVGRRGVSQLDRFFMGSVSQKISSYASCAVLIVH
jgi:nucleotide-binding universal stress UspA family protein